MGERWIGPGMADSCRLAGSKQGLREPCRGFLFEDRSSMRALIRATREVLNRGEKPEPKVREAKRGANSGQRPGIDSCLVTRVTLPESISNHNGVS